MNNEVLVIGKLKAYGFASIVELKYNFSRPGLSTIVGENGSGKTQIINAMFWCIYGKTVKPGCSITPWLHTQDEEFKGTIVSLAMQRGKDSYKIIRCSEYTEKVGNTKGGNRLILEVNGEVSPIRDKKEMQAEINKIVGASPELFKNSILFGQKLKRLIEEDGPVKKKVFEEAFDTLFIPQAKDKIEKKIAPLAAELKVKELTLKSLHDTIENLRESLRTAKKLGEEARLKWEESINEWRGKLREAERYYRTLKPTKVIDYGSMYKLRKKLKDLEEKDRVYNSAELKANLLMNTNQGHLEVIQCLVSDLKEKFIKVPKICDECGQSLPKKAIQDYKNNVSSKIKEAKENEKEAKRLTEHTKKEYMGILNEYASFKEKKKKKESIIKKKLQKLEELQANNNKQIDITAERIRAAKEQIIALEANPPELTRKTVKSFKGLLSNKKAEYTSLQEEINKMREELSINQWLIKDPLSNGGLKAYIFSSRLTEVNRALRKYEPYIGFRVEAGIDLERHNKDFYINIYKAKVAIPYADLSGGQQQLASLALAFAIYDVRAKINPIACKITDEAFESLSQNNLEIVSNILQDKANKISVHVITHQKEFNPLNCYRRVVELNAKGQTVIASKLQQN